VKIVSALVDPVGTIQAKKKYHYAMASAANGRPERMVHRRKREKTNTECCISRRSDKGCSLKRTTKLSNTGATIKFNR